MSWDAEKAASEMCWAMDRLSTNEERWSFFRRQLSGAYVAGVRDSQEVCLRAANGDRATIDVALDLAQQVSSLWQKV